MSVYLSSAVVGNEETLVTLGQSGEIMAWFYPHKDHAQNIHECLPCIYVGEPGHGQLIWAYDERLKRHQAYLGDSNAVVTTLSSQELELKIEFTDVVPDGSPVLLRQIKVSHSGSAPRPVGIFLYGDWNMGGIRTGNTLTFSRGSGLLVQGHHDVAAVVGGDAVEQWQCGKAGLEWGHNPHHALANGQLWCQDLELGDVSWATGFRAVLEPGQTLTRHLTFALGQTQQEAIENWNDAQQKTFAEHLRARQRTDEAWLQPGLKTLEKAENIPTELLGAYKRCLLCLPLLTGVEGVALAAPEFDFEFISCGGYGYFWPRDGAEYLSGLLDAGYPEFAEKIFDWCALHQDPTGLWHQRYFLNGEPGPNWCLPPDMLQIDQVGAVLWGYGKWFDAQGKKYKAKPVHAQMVRLAADYLLSRLTDKGVHGNAFDTWETFVGSFTYSNAAIYAAFVTAHQVLGEEKYAEGAARVKAGVLQHFVRNGDKTREYLVRGFNAAGEPDNIVDSASLGAIEPFGLLDLNNPADLKLAVGTLREISHRLECDWEGGRAIRRFERDAYVGGVPACVNTLWMARCSLTIAARLRELGDVEQAETLTNKAQTYLLTVLRRATPTGLLPELMQGPTGQSFWAAPHGWAMSSFVSGVLMLAAEKQK